MSQLKVPEINSEELKPVDNNDARCAPGIEYKSGSCMDVEILSALAHAYNKEYPNKKIELDDKWIVLNADKYKRYLVFNLKQRIDKPQREWENMKFAKMVNKEIRNKLEDSTFRPMGPQGKFEWLNTIQIEEVQKQYQNLKYEDYEFLGAVPIDFDLINNKFKNINFKEYVDKGKTKLGVVFNLDKHDEPGSHWVGLYMDLKKGQIYFFDSYGTTPEPEIQAFMRKASRYLESTGMKPSDIDMRWNKVQHQRKGSECGVYSINFILRMLRGDNFDDLCKNPVSDEKINRCRRKYFENTK